MEKRSFHIMVDRLYQRIRRGVEEGLFPCCVVGVTTDGGRRSIVFHGRHTYDPDSDPVAEDSIFDVASITKVIPTSCLALALTERGRLLIDAPVVKYLPQLQSPSASSITVRHLLTHTLDFGFRLSSMRDLPAGKILESVLQASMKSLPGRVFSYSNATSIILGLLVEEIGGTDLDRLGRQMFFEPLQMENTGFVPRVREKTVPTEFDSWRGRIVCGEVHDESAHALWPKFVGSAGLFSTVPDLLSFMEMLINDGIRQEKRYFSPEMIGFMSSNQIAELGGCTGLGWELNQRRFMGRRSSPRTIGKTGFTGCMCMADLEHRTALVALSNWTFPARKSDNALINEFRSDIADIALEEMCGIGLS